MLSVPDRRSATPLQLSGLVSAPGAVTLRMTLSTASGQILTGGVARIAESAASGWTASLSHLDQPGVIAAMYFASGVRDVVVHIEDGREARARISGTSFAGSERVCTLTGLGPLCERSRLAG